MKGPRFQGENQRRNTPTGWKTACSLRCGGRRVGVGRRPRWQHLGESSRKLVRAAPRGTQPCFGRSGRSTWAAVVGLGLCAISGTFSWRSGRPSLRISLGRASGGPALPGPLWGKGVPWRRRDRGVRPRLRPPEGGPSASTSCRGPGLRVWKVVAGRRRTDFAVDQVGRFCMMVLGPRSRVSVSRSRSRLRDARGFFRPAAMVLTSAPILRSISGSRWTSPRTAIGPTAVPAWPVRNQGRPGLQGQWKALKYSIRKRARRRSCSRVFARLRELAVDPWSRVASANRVGHGRPASTSHGPYGCGQGCRGFLTPRVWGR